MSEANNEKSEDKKDIEVEEREKMLNAENKAQDEKSKEGGEEENEEQKRAKELKEGMEVKPKKIPIGGIQMPGFFTRSKSKERCKDENDQNEVEGTELIEKSADNAPGNTPQQTKIKLPNPFRRSKLEEDGAKPAETKEKKKLLDTIKLPLVSVFPRKKKDDNLEQQTAQAGLASMETLDDKSTDEKGTEDFKNVALEESKGDAEQQDQGKAVAWIEKLRVYKVAICAFLIFLLIVIIILIIALAGSKHPVSPPVRDGKYIETITTCGKVEGLMEDSAFTFRGIPYARPPLGDLRFKSAQPLNNLAYCWNGTFLAHNATDVCLQILSNGTMIGTEDCLTLDVVTPYVRYENPLPVIVLIGSESFIGGSPGIMRPSARYARSKDVVFVRPNFRLGPLGFLALNVLSMSDYPNSSGNYALSDILAVLKWVEFNIEHFGGDKQSVTLWGHRAGATLVMALSTIHNATNYFTRAWASSGGAIYPNKTLLEAEIENESFLRAVGCDTAECLRSIEAEKLMTAVEDTWRKPQPDLPAKDENPKKRHQWLVIDGKILRETPETVWSSEWPKKAKIPVPLVIGSTAQSAHSEKLSLKHTKWTEDLVKQHIEQSFLSEKNLVKEAVQMYPLTYKDLITMISDIRIVCPLWALSMQMRKVPFYVVTQSRFEKGLADIDSDVEAILGRYEPITPEERRYVSAMQGMFYHFVWHGKVEQNLYGQTVLVVGQDVLANATYSYCDFWKEKDILSYALLD